MDARTSPSTQAVFDAQEPAKLILDPLEEWRDCANQWDVSEVWGKPAPRVARRPNERLDVAPAVTGR